MGLLLWYKVEYEYDLNLQLQYYCDDVEYYDINEYDMQNSEAN